MKSNEEALAIHEMEEAEEQHLFQELDKRFEHLSKVEGWNEEEYDVEYEKFLLNSKEYFDL